MPSAKSRPETHLQVQGTGGAGEETAPDQTSMARKFPRHVLARVGGWAQRPRCPRVNAPPTASSRHRRTGVSASADP